MHHDKVQGRLALSKEMQCPTVPCHANNQLDVAQVHATSLSWVSVAAVETVAGDRIHAEEEMPGSKKLCGTQFTDG